MKIRSTFLLRAQRGTKTPAESARRGSAIVIVLGMLSVLMLMSIAFTTFMRTEHAGSTNLKNGLVARQALSTAIARVTDSIDNSVDIPLDGAPFPPAPVWPEPWLASSSTPTNDYMQSVALTPTERPGAQVLTYEMSRYLTPAQIELVRSAKVDWAPIYASVGNGTLNSARASGVNLYGNIGRPARDSVVGRYAFVALPTTGLLDLNLAGTNANSQASNAESSAPRASSDGSNAHSFFLPESNAKFVWNSDGDTVEVPRQIENPGKFLTARRSLGAFSSFLDARLELESNWAGALWLGGHADAKKSGLKLTWPGEAKSAANATRWTSGKPDDKGKSFFPADTFAGFSTAVEGVDPEGFPRVHLPTPAEFRKIASDAKYAKAFGTRCLSALSRVFARSRMSAGLPKAKWKDWETDSYSFFEKEQKANYTLSKARLATVSMLDALDEDLTPGFVKNSSSSWWDILPDIDTGVTVVSPDEEAENVTDPKPGAGTNPLNYPATEAIPLLSHAYAYITWEEVTTNMVRGGAAAGENVPFDGQTGWQKWANTTDGTTTEDQINDDMKKWRVVYHGKIHCGAVANIRADTPDWSSRFENRKYSMKMEWGIMPSYPRSVSRLPRNTEQLDVLLNGDNQQWAWGRKKGSVPVEPDQPFPPETPSVKGPFSTAAINLSVGGSGSGSRIIEVDTDNKTSGDGPVDFYVICNPKKRLTCADYAEPDRDSKGNVIPHQYTGWKGGDDGALKALEFYPPTLAEELYNNDKKYTDVFIPICMKVTITDNSDGRVVQQVPAPAIDDAEKKYWLRLDAGAWHKPGNNDATLYKGNRYDATSGSQAQTYIAKIKEGDRGDAMLNLAWGWAICAVPEFGFDTTSLVTEEDQDDPCGVQINAFPSATQVWLNNRICMNTENKIYTIRAGDKKHAAELVKTIDRDGAFEHLMGPSTGDKFGENGMSKATVGNVLMSRFLTDAFVGSGGTPTFALATTWMRGNCSFLDNHGQPDFVHRWKNPFGSKKDVDEGALYWNAAAADNTAMVKTHLHNFRRNQSLSDESRENAVFRNPGDMGSIMCGPLETLSLFRTYRTTEETFGQPSYVADFHPVFDYFSGSPDARYPKDSPYADGSTPDNLGYWKREALDSGTGVLKDGAFGNKEGNGESDMAKKLAYAGVLTNGAVNLNAPLLVHLEGQQGKPPRALQWVFGDGSRTYDGLLRKAPNLYPFLSAIAGARYQVPKGPVSSASGSQSAPKQLNESQAASIASALFLGLETGARRYGSRRFGIPKNFVDADDDGWPQARSLSDALGAPVGEETEPNALLEELVNGASGLEDLKTDDDREAILGSIGGAFATRGQSFLVLVRADAYTPKYGEEESTSDGNSLATTHALVELWRDPEPARTPYGTFPRDAQRRPYLFHDWQVRSVRVF